MKFVKYKLIPRKNGLHISPEPLFDRMKYRLEVIFFPIDMLDYHIARVSENWTVAPYSAFHMEEITQEEALEIAKNADPDATMSDDGDLILPNMVTFIPDENT
jgi:hypothetical protein